MHAQTMYSLVFLIFKLNDNSTILQVVSWKLFSINFWDSFLLQVITTGHSLSFRIISLRVNVPNLWIHPPQSDVSLFVVTNYYKCYYEHSCTFLNISKRKNIVEHDFKSKPRSQDLQTFMSARCNCFLQEWWLAQCVSSTDLL